MRNIIALFAQVMRDPITFFEQVREETSWVPAVRHWLILAAWLSLGSVTAWGFGIAGNTPLNSSLGAQMEVYDYWHDTLLPTYGLWSYPIAAGLIMLTMLFITILFTPLLFVIMRYLGGAEENRGLLRAFQGFAYGLTPCAFGGFLPILGLVTGVYATILQLYVGPSITLRNRTVFAILPLVLLLSAAIAQYWQGGLL